MSAVVSSGSVSSESALRDTYWPGEHMGSLWAWTSCSIVGSGGVGGLAVLTAETTDKSNKH